MQCNDPKCPKHGSLKVRGNVFTGVVKSAKPAKTVIVERILTKYVPKYERYKKTRSKIAAHNPECMAAKEGDTIEIGETRKLSKTKSFVVIKIKKRAVEEEKVAEKIKKDEEEKVKKKQGAKNAGD
ncbi:MAG: 30S ribosomal protein S17 [Candidatus Diapherotrites archaeon]|nr:30S ribosomal protein S17 [Candidatus Diapherotrites archaeon]